MPVGTHTCTPGMQQGLSGTDTRLFNVFSKRPERGWRARCRLGTERRPARSAAWGARAGPAHPSSLLRGWELGRQLCRGRGSEGPEQAGREGLPLRRVRASVCERSPLMLAACIFVGL